MGKDVDERDEKASMREGFKELRADCAIFDEYGSIEDEEELHKMDVDKHPNGEWF